MVFQKDVLILNQVEHNAIDLMKQFHLSIPLYRSVRKNKGYTPEEAFLYCWKAKEKEKVFKNQNIRKYAKETGIAATVFYEGVKKGKTKEEILQEQLIKKEESKEFLNWLYEQGLPKEYSSLKSFCKKNGVNYRLTMYYLQTGFDLYGAVKKSLHSHFRRGEYNYVHLPLKSIAEKYLLDYSQLLFWVKETSSYEEAIKREIFTRTFHKNMGNRINYLWQNYHLFFIQGLEKPEGVTKEEWICFGKCYERTKQIQKEFTYYHFLEQIPILEFRNLSLENRVCKVLKDFKTLFTLEELYFILDFDHGFMKDFDYIEEHQLWVYRGNKEALQVLKKSSH